MQTQKIPVLKAKDLCFLFNFGKYTEILSLKTKHMHSEM